MNKRLAMLQSMVASGQADSFVWYALAIEYQNAQDLDQALATFAELRQRDPDYLPQYLIAGQLHSRLGRGHDAQDLFRAGIALAQRQGDARALSELQGALEQETDGAGDSLE